nr:hypothetical protein [uncultured Albidiferax sp.]
MLSLLKAIGILVLVLLAMGIGLVALPTVWMITFGLIIPGFAIAVLPLRVLYVVFANSWRNRWIFLALLIPWGYFVSQVISRGFISKSSLGQGPTVNPYAWLGIVIAWGAIELVCSAQTRVTKQDS